MPHWKALPLPDCETLSSQISQSLKETVSVRGRLSQLCCLKYEFASCILCLYSIYPTFMITCVRRGVGNITNTTWFPNEYLDSWIHLDSPPILWQQTSEGAEKGPCRGQIPLRTRHWIIQPGNLILKDKYQETDFFSLFIFHTFCSNLSTSKNKTRTMA